MSAMLAIGVAQDGGSLAVATMRRGRPVAEATFPFTALGAEAIRVFLADCAEPFRLAVSSALLGTACGWDYGHDQEAIVVTATTAAHASDLAAYAARGSSCC